MIYALGLGACERGVHYMQSTGFGGWLLFAACTGAVFMAGARLMEVTRKDNSPPPPQVGLFPRSPKIGKFRQLAAHVGRPAAPQHYPPSQKRRISAEKSIWHAPC